MSDAFLQLFRARAQSGILSFEDFMRLALYAPDIGYYTKENPARTGSSPRSDFYTSSNIPLFSDLVIAAASNLHRQLLPTIPLNQTHFIEIGAEPDTAILGNSTPHLFASARSIRINDPIQLSGPCIIFSNELFDAQPVHRFVTKNHRWHEILVAETNGSFTEQIAGSSTAEAWLPDPTNLPDQLHFDAPRASVQLLDHIASQPWHGLFLALDYGKSSDQLLLENPGGTLRAYQRHQQHNDLLANPTDQDLTAHICWDWLIDSLQGHHFQQAILQSQESLFIHHSAEILEQLTLNGTLTQKQSLQRLLHPGQLGQKFQSLHAYRPAPPPVF